MAKRKKPAQPNGRPRKFKTPEELQEKIDKYFARCDSNTVEIWNKKEERKETIAKPIPYTIEGLCNALDIDRKTLLNYSNKDNFFHIIRKAKADVHQNQIEMALGNRSKETLTIFLLKNNANYTDKSEVKQDINANVSLKVEWE